MNLGERGDVLSQVIFLVCRWLKLLKLRSATVCQLKFPELQSLSADSQPQSGNPKLWDIQHVLTQAASRISFLNLVCSTKMYLLLRLNLVPRTIYSTQLKAVNLCWLVLHIVNHQSCLLLVAHCNKDVTAGLLLLLESVSGVGCWCLGFELPTKCIQLPPIHFQSTDYCKSVSVFCSLCNGTPSLHIIFPVLKTTQSPFWTPR